MMVENIKHQNFCYIHILYTIQLALTLCDRTQHSIFSFLSEKMRKKFSRSPPFCRLKIDYVSILSIERKIGQQKNNRDASLTFW